MTTLPTFHPDTAAALEYHDTCRVVRDLVLQWQGDNEIEQDLQAYLGMTDLEWVFYQATGLVPVTYKLVRP